MSLDFVKTPPVALPKKRKLIKMIAITIMIVIITIMVKIKVIIIPLTIIAMIVIKMLIMIIATIIFQRIKAKYIRDIQYLLVQISFWRTQGTASIFKLHHLSCEIKMIMKVFFISLFAIIIIISVAMLIKKILSCMGYLQ